MHVTQRFGFKAKGPAFGAGFVQDRPGIFVQRGQLFVEPAEVRRLMEEDEGVTGEIVKIPVGGLEVFG